MPKFGWPEGHGEKRREEIRGFAREEAGALAKAKMAEIEREQTGQTRRAGITEAGAMERERLQETGRAERGRLQFGAEGVAGRLLSEAVSKTKRERQEKDFDIGVEGMLAKYYKTGVSDTGEIITEKPDWTRSLYAEAKAMGGKKGLEYIKESIGKREEIETERARLMAMTPEQLAAEREKEIGAPSVTPKALTPEEQIFEDIKAKTERISPKRRSFFQRAVPDVSPEETERRQRIADVYEKFLVPQQRTLGGWR